MISPHAKLSIETLPLECLQCKEVQPRYLERLLLYVQKMREAPDDYAGVIHVTPSNTHPGMFCILDGTHRYVASILTGRKDALCLIVEEPPTRKEIHAHVPD